MSTASDFNTEAANLTDAEQQGATLWNLWGRNVCNTAVQQKKMSQVFDLGGNADFRQGFRAAAEIEGFETALVLLGPSFTVSWA